MTQLVSRCLLVHLQPTTSIITLQCRDEGTPSRRSTRPSSRRRRARNFPQVPPPARCPRTSLRSHSLPALLLLTAEDLRSEPWYQPEPWACCSRPSTRRQVRLRVEGAISSHYRFPSTPKCLRGTAISSRHRPSSLPSCTSTEGLSRYLRDDRVRPRRPCRTSRPAKATATTPSLRRLLVRYPRRHGLRRARRATP